VSFASVSIVVFGKCGVGKSTTLNKLFDLASPTDDVVPCTSDAREFLLDSTDTQHSLNVVDLPGHGESIAKDEEYHGLYVSWIERADVILWILQADTRAYKRDQALMLQLLPRMRETARLVIGVNKSDLLSIMESEHPGRDLIGRRLRDIQTEFDEIFAELPNHYEIYPYSAIDGAGLEQLKHTLVTPSKGKGSC
jgi:predicted GTPase